MKRQVLHTVWCNIAGEAVEEKFEIDQSWEWKGFKKQSGLGEDFDRASGPEAWLRRRHLSAVFLFLFQRTSSCTMSTTRRYSLEHFRCGATTLGSRGFSLSGSWGRNGEGLGPRPPRARNLWNPGYGAPHLSDDNEKCLLKSILSSSWARCGRASRLRMLDRMSNSRRACLL